jgi:hypothetical protein
MPKILQQKLFISEYTDEKIRKIFFDTCKCTIEDEIKKDSKIFYYWTFFLGDYQQKMVTLTLVESQPDFVQIIAPQKRIDDAISWLKENNKHLKFGKRTDFVESVRDGMLLVELELLND